MDGKSSTRSRAYRAAQIIGVIAVCAAVTHCGVLGNLHGNPGYAAFGSPGIDDTNRELAISLGALPLRLARFVTRDDPEIAPLLRDLQAVRVYIYEVDGDLERVHTRMEGVRERLIRTGWNQVVAVREDGELVNALVKLDEHGTLRGMAVVVQDGEDLVLVNLIGKIRPESFSALMAGLDIDVPQVMVSAAGR